MVGCPLSGSSRAQREERHAIWWKNSSEGKELRQEQRNTKCSGTAVQQIMGYPSPVPMPGIRIRISKTKVLKL